MPLGDSDSSIVPASIADSDDGWAVQSNSVGQPSSAELAAQLRDTPDPANRAAEPAESATEPEPEPEPEPIAAAEPVPAAKPAKRESSEERIARIRAEINAETRRFHDAKRAREAEEAQTARLKQERAALTQTTSDLGPRPTWKAFEDAGKSFDDYETARNAWDDARAAEIKAAVLKDAQTQIEQARAKATAEATLRAEREQFQRRLDAAMVKYPDFKDLSAAGDAVPLTDFLEDAVTRHEQGAELLYQLLKHPEDAQVLSTLPLTNAMMAAVQATTDPAKLLLHFAQNPDECQRYAAMPPLAATAALVKLTSSLDGAKTGSPSAAPITRANPPIRPPVGARPARDGRDPIDDEFNADLIAAVNARDRDKRAHY